MLCEGCVVGIEVCCKFVVLKKSWELRGQRGNGHKKSPMLSDRGRGRSRKPAQSFYGEHPFVLSAGHFLDLLPTFT